MIDAAEQALQGLDTDHVPVEFEQDADSPGRFSIDIPLGTDVDQILIRVTRSGGQTDANVVDWLNRARIADSEFVSELDRRASRGHACGAGTQGKRTAHQHR